MTTLLYNKSVSSGILFVCLGFVWGFFLFCFGFNTSKVEEGKKGVWDIQCEWRVLGLNLSFSSVHTAATTDHWDLREDHRRFIFWECWTHPDGVRTVMLGSTLETSK